MSYSDALDRVLDAAQRETQGFAKDNAFGARREVEDLRGYKALLFSHMRNSILQDCGFSSDCSDKTLALTIKSPIAYVIFGELVKMLTNAHAENFLSTVLSIKGREETARITVSFDGKKSPGEVVEDLRAELAIAYVNLFFFASGHAAQLSGGFCYTTSTHPAAIAAANWLVGHGFFEEHPEKKGYWRGVKKAECGK